MGSVLFLMDLLSRHEPGRARLLPSRVKSRRAAARREPRPTEPRFRESLVAIPGGLARRQPKLGAAPLARPERLTLRAQSGEEGIPLKAQPVQSDGGSAGREFQADGRLAAM